MSDRLPTMMGWVRYLTGRLLPPRRLTVQDLKEGIPIKSGWRATEVVNESSVVIASTPAPFRPRLVALRDMEEPLMGAGLPSREAGTVALEDQAVLVTINGTEHMWTDTERVSFEEIVRAAFPEATSMEGWTVVYRFRYSGGLGGSMKGPGDSIGLVDDMVFNVARTDNA